MNAPFFPISKEKKYEHAGIAVFSLAVCAILFSVIAPDTRALDGEATIITSLPSPDAFKEMSLTAKSAIVYDIQTGNILFAEHAEAQLPLASLTKLITGVIAVETLGRDAVVTITEEALSTEGDSGLRVGERWRTEDLSAFALITSSNDGAAALGASVREAVKMETYSGYMARKITEMGLSQTYVVDSTGLDLSTSVAGAYGSAYDIARLLHYMYHNTPDLLFMSSEGTTTFTTLSGTRHTATNTNPFTESTPGLLGSKTGFTDLAGGNLGIIVDVGINRPIAVVVLGSTREGRFEDVRRLLERTHQHFAYAN